MGGVPFSDSFGKRVGNGHACFWKTKWLGNFRLCEKFPRLFSLESDK